MAEISYFIGSISTQSQNGYSDKYCLIIFMTRCAARMDS